MHNNLREYDKLKKIWALERIYIESALYRSIIINFYTCSITNYPPISIPVMQQWKPTE